MPTFTDLSKSFFFLFGILNVFLLSFIVIELLFARPYTYFLEVGLICAYIFIPSLRIKKPYLIVF